MEADEKILKELRILIKKVINEHFSSENTLDEFSFSNMLHSRISIENYPEEKIRNLITTNKGIPELIEAIKFSRYTDEFKEKSEENDIVDELDVVIANDNITGEVIEEPAIEWEKHGTEPCISEKERENVLKKYIENFYNFVRSKTGLMAINLAE